jgi:uncharacterized surface protein with fasciclin (FAS1) repeats
MAALARASALLLACLGLATVATVATGTLQQAGRPGAPRSDSPTLYVCQKGQCVPDARGLPLAECQQACVPPPSENYTCHSGQCVVSGSGLPKAECTQVCGGPGPAPAPAVPDVVSRAVATPDLSTFVTALKAGGLVTTLEGHLGFTEEFTVFAPSNKAFQNLPAGVLANLLKPENKAALDNVLTYHVVGNHTALHTKSLVDREVLTTLEGNELTVRRSGDDVFINSAKVTTANLSASNGIVHIIDEVLLPCPAEPADGKHLWFRGFTLSDESDPSGKYQCGEVDAGPRLPDDIFDPSNAAALKAYEAATIALFSFCNTRGCTFGPFLELGRCADKNYTVLGHSKTNGQTFPNKTERVDWAPHKLMDGVCQKQCLCNFGNGTGGKPSLQLPTCQDQPDDPRARKFCSLCGPKYNTPIEISLFECGVPSCPRPSKPPSSCSWPLCNTTGRCCSEVCRDEGCGAHCPICGPGVGTPGDSCYGCSASSDCNRSC